MPSGDLFMPPPGQDIGALCPQCKQGHLHIRIEHRTNRPKDMMQVVIGMSYASWELVSDLECNDCSAVYGAKLRGSNVQVLLDQQVRKFKNPPVLPTDCPNCHYGLTRTHTGSPSDGLDLSAQRRREERTCTTALIHCRGCNLVVWVEPKKPLIPEHLPVSTSQPDPRRRRPGRKR